MDLNGVVGGADNGQALLGTLVCFINAVWNPTDGRTLRSQDANEVQELDAQSGARNSEAEFGANAYI
jgi:hypothetical protein